MEQLGLIRNDDDAPCRNCGGTHAFYTRRCRPVVLPLAGWGHRPVEPWRWRMVWWTDWWSWYAHRVGNQVSREVRELVCRYRGHRWVADTAHLAGEHPLVACDRCGKVHDLASDEQIAAEGRVVHRVK